MLKNDTIIYMNSSFTKVQHNFFLILFICSAGVMFLIWRPFLSSLVLAASFAIVFHPLYNRIARLFRGNGSFASLLTVIIILLVVLIPLALIGFLLFNEARSLYISVATGSGSTALVNGLVDNIQSHIQEYIPSFHVDFPFYVQNVLQWGINHLDLFFSSFLSILVGTVVMIIAMFFFLRDGKAFKNKLFILSPLDHKYDQDIFQKLVQTINSVIKGSLVIGITQGIFATIGFTITGVPNPLIWGVAATLASFIPGVGTSLVTVPCMIFLYFTAPLWHSVVLLVWALGGVGLIDNLLTPYILNRGIQIHPFLILISVLGGITFFGPLGFIMGPIMLAFFFALLDIYPLIIKEQQ